MQRKRYINWKITICFPKVQCNKGVLPWPSLFLSPQSSFLSPLLTLLDQCPQDLDLFDAIIPLHLYQKSASRETIAVICNLLSDLS